MSKKDSYNRLMLNKGCKCIMSKEYVEIGVEDLNGNVSTQLLVHILNLFLIVLYIYYIVKNEVYVLDSLFKVIEGFLATSLTFCNVLLFYMLNKGLDMFLVSYYMLRGYNLDKEAESSVACANDLLFGLMLYNIFVLLLFILFK